jgi:predicted PurR-regulated permease PerM
VPLERLLGHEQLLSFVLHQDLAVGLEEALRGALSGELSLLTGLGLWLVGVPSPLALGLIAGLLEIIPYAGPIISAVPGLILALTQSPTEALWALLVYVVVQQIEGNILMPVVQKKAVSLPPALTVFGVVAAGILFGIPGLTFAGPLLVVAFVLVKRLYVRGALGTSTPVPGEAQPPAGSKGE